MTAHRSALAPVLVVLLAAAALVAVVAVVAREAGPAAAERVAGVGPQGRVPQFVVECGWSHAAPDDPIVHPGRPGRSHLHDFFGSTTPADPVGGDTTCENKLDTAAYWAPALLEDGTAVTPIGSVAYYRPGPDVDPATVVPFPAGLLMIAGDPGATAPQPLAVAAWHCGASPVLRADPPVCPRTAPLAIRIAFPDCWDGTRLDSEDHRSHVARSEDGACPAGHPVPIPQLTFEVLYPLTGDRGRLELSSGSTRGVHADFVNGWDQRALEREVRACLNRSKVCGVVSRRATG